MCAFTGFDQQIDQRISIDHPRTIGGKARIVGKAVEADHAHQDAELPIVAYRDHHIAVGCLERLIRHHSRVLVAPARGIFARHQHRRADIGQHRQLAVVEGEIDVLADPVTVGGNQGSKHRLRGRHAGKQVRNCHAHADRRLVASAVDRHQATGGLNDIVIARQCRERTFAPVSRDRAIDEAGVDRRQAGIIEPVFVEPAELEIFDHDIGLRAKAFTAACPAAQDRSIATDFLVRLAHR